MSHGLTWVASCKGGQEYEQLARGTRGLLVISQEWMNCYSIKIEILWEREMDLEVTAGLVNLWHLSHFPLVSLRKRIFVLLQLLSWVLYSPADALTWIPSSAICFAVSHHQNSSSNTSLATILLLLHRPLHRISDQTFLGSDPISGY